MIDALFEIGKSKPLGDRVSSIDWVDIKAWHDVTGADLSPDELGALKMLSSVYVSQYYESLDAGCPSPNIESLKDKEVIAGKIKGLFSLLRG